MDELDWCHFYVLGWFDRQKRGYLTSWENGPPLSNAVVLGCAANRIPLWDDRVPDGARLELVPEGRDPHEYAAEVNGVYAIGWRVPVPTRIVRAVLES